MNSTTLQTAARLHTQAIGLYRRLTDTGAPFALTTRAYDRAWRRYELVSKLVKGAR